MKIPIAATKTMPPTAAPTPTPKADCYDVITYIIQLAGYSPVMIVVNEFKFTSLSGRVEAIK